MSVEALDNISCPIAPVADSHLANKAYVDAAVAAGAGTASVSGDNVVSIPATSLISCGLAPTEDSHLANKAYVDAAVAAAGSATPIEEPAALGRVVYVTTLSDAADHTGTSLRDAIEAVTDKDSVVIKFSVSGTITLEQGEIVIPVGNIAIDGEDKITISGGGVSRVFSMTNAYAVLSLHRLTITGGNGVGASQNLVYGGAVLLTVSSVFEARKVTFDGNSISGTAATVGGGAFGANNGRAYFVDCVFNGNSAATTSGTTTATAQGGAVNVSSTYSVIEFERCTFTNNTVFGRINSYGGACQCGNAVYRDCVFRGNTINDDTQTAQRGGAIYATNGFLSVSGCVFENNVSGFNTGANIQGGAICAYAPYYVRITDSEFTGNTAAYGGSISLYGSSGTQPRYCVIARCNFTRHFSLTNGDRAVAIYCYYLSVTIEDCEFTGNFQNTSSGVIYCYGYTNKTQQVTINRCLFTENSVSATTTGLIYCANLAQVYVYNSVFTGNSFTATSGNHKCVYTTGTDTWAFIYNCTFTNNDNKGGAFYAAAGGVDIYNSVEVGNGSASGKGTNATVNASNFLSDQSASVGRDIAYDSSKPLFAADGYTPVANSQVIDAGDDDYVETVYDLVGKARVSGTSVDVGAVEYQGA